MSRKQPKIIIIGASIIGASIGHAQAKAGALVTLVDQGVPGDGVTARSFGWINVNHGMAEDYHHLRQEAIQAWRRLDHDLGGGIINTWRGALVWHGKAAQTEVFVRDHLAWGYDTRLVERAEIVALEPALIHPPGIAAFSPGEGAVEPTSAVGRLIRAAGDAGAMLVERITARAVTTQNGRVTGIRADGGEMAADVVVLAAGLGSPALSGTPGLTDSIETTPALLLRFDVPENLINRIIFNPGFEIRQTPNGQLLAADDCPPNVNQDIAEAKGRKTLERIRAGSVREKGTESLDLIQDPSLTRFGVTEGGSLRRRDTGFAPCVTGHRLWHEPWIKSSHSDLGWGLDHEPRHGFSSPGNQEPLWCDRPSPQLVTPAETGTHAACGPAIRRFNQMIHQRGGIKRQRRGSPPARE